MITQKTWEIMYICTQVLNVDHRILIQNRTDSAPFLITSELLLCIPFILIFMLSLMLSPLGTRMFFQENPDRSAKIRVNSLSGKCFQTASSILPSLSMLSSFCLSHSQLFCSSFSSVFIHPLLFHPSFLVHLPLSP